MKSYFVFLSRNKLYAAIQLFGLSVAMGFIILLISYARTEFSVGRNQSRSGEVYLAGSAESGHLTVDAPSRLFADMSEIRDWARTGQKEKIEIVHEDGLILAEALSVDTSFFSFFDYELRGCDRRRVLAAPNEVLISESFARKMFPGQEAVGKTLVTKGGEAFTIVGVAEDFDADDLFKPADILTSMMRDEKMYGQGTFRFPTFVRLVDGVSQERAEEALLRQYTQVFKDWTREKENEWSWLWGASLTPLKDVYFSPISSSLRHGDHRMVLALTLVTLVLLVSAVFNYINLTLAQVGKRAKETATRRLLGDTIATVVGRNFAEALLFVLCSLVCAGVLAIIIEPWFEELLESRIHFFADTWTVLGTAAMVFGTAFLAGLLPAMIVARFKPLDVVKGTFRFYNKKWLSRIFIVGQNVISTLLIAVGLTMAVQMHHLDTLPLGYKTENLITVYTMDLSRNRDKIQPLVNALKALPEVKDVGNLSNAPYNCNTNSVEMPGSDPEAEQQPWLSLSMMDSTCFRMFGFEVLETYCKPEEEYVWITEETRNRFSVTPEQPYIGDKKNEAGYNVCGIIREYRSYDAMEEPMTDVHNAVQVLNNSPYQIGLLAELQPMDKAGTKAALDKIKDVCRKMSIELCGVDKNLDVVTVKDELAEPMKQQHNVTALVLCFMAVSVLISALGMLGMAVSYTEQNRKQIALRRVMGATPSAAVWELARPFLLMTLLAALLALPFAIMVMQRYLEDFYNRIAFPWWIVILSVLASLLISLCSVIRHAFAVAHSNPVESIRTE